MEMDENHRKCIKICSKKSLILTSSLILFWLNSKQEYNWKYTAIPLGNTVVFLCLFLHILFVLALEQDRGVDCSRQICSWPRFVRDISSRFRAISSWRSTYEFVTNFIWILVSRSWFRLRGYVSKLTRRDTFHQSSFISTTLSFFDCRQGWTNWYVMWAVQYWENFVRGKIWWLWKIC